MNFQFHFQISQVSTFMWGCIFFETKTVLNAIYSSLLLFFLNCSEYQETTDLMMNYHSQRGSPPTREKAIKNNW